MQVTVTKSKLNRLCEVAIFKQDAPSSLKFLDILHRLTLEEDIISISLSHEEYILLKEMQ